jgi:hypothetical protein
MGKFKQESSYALSYISYSVVTKFDSINRRIELALFTFSNDRNDQAESIFNSILRKLAAIKDIKLINVHIEELFNAYTSQKYIC